MKSKKKILFLTEKWCDGNPDMGLTNHYHNLFGTLASLDNVEIGVFHYDEYKYTSNKHVDEEIPNVMKSFEPDVVVVSHLGTSLMNPTRKSYEFMHNLGVKVVFIWPDTRDSIIDTIRELEDVSSLHVSWCYERDETIIDNHIRLPTPQDPRMYYKQKTKQYDAVFVGSLNGYTHRGPFIQHTQQEGCKLSVSGGQREAKLSPEQYAFLIASSKVSVNFSESAIKGEHQMKGRVLETLSAGVMLLEYKNDVTSKLLTPGVHYAEFGTKEELAEKINYYLEHDEEREKIAAAGYELYNKRFSPACFWGTIFKRIGVEV